jgi:hypothetical protein
MQQSQSFTPPHSLRRPSEVMPNQAAIETFQSDMDEESTIQSIQLCHIMYRMTYLFLLHLYRIMLILLNGYHTTLHHILLKNLSIFYSER